MPPPPAPSFSGISATIASVVRMFFAIEAAFWSAEGVLDAVLLLLHLRLGGRADLHDGDAAGELREALLELLAVEVGVGGLDLRLDLVDAALDRLRLAGPVDERRRVLRDDDAAGAA